MPQWQFKLLEFTIREQLAIDKDEYIPGKDNRKFIIQMYGLNSEGKTASIFVRGYNPFFYILVGDDWTEQTVMEFQAYLKKEIGSYFEDSLKGNCIVCVNEIDYDNFHCGHIKSVFYGGETTLSNLEPICASCNLNMGTQDLNVYKKELGRELELCF